MNDSQQNDRSTSEQMPTGAADLIPTKDLYERFAKLRDSTQYAGFYLLVAAALLLGWSRSPTWNFKIPFELFTQQNGSPLSVPCGYAPVFGPIVLLFFYARLYVLYQETQRLRAVLIGQIRESTPQKTLLNPPFKFSKNISVDSFLFFGLVLGGTSILTVMLLCDFFTLQDHGRPLWQSLYTVRGFYGVMPTHNSNPTNLTVFGFPHAWLYIVFTVVEFLMIGAIATGVWRETVGESQVGQNGGKKEPKKPRK